MTVGGIVLGPTEDIAGTRLTLERGVPFFPTFGAERRNAYAGEALFLGVRPCRANVLGKVFPNLRRC